MPNQRAIPSEESKSVATFTLLSEGEELSKAYQVLSLVVSKELNRIPFARLLILDGDPATESFEISNKDEFIPGKHIEIKVGYRNDEETVFKGIVIKHGIKIRENGSLLVIDCKDEASKMTVTCKSQYFYESTDSDVIEALIDGHGLQKQVEPTDAVHQQVVQYNTTDWDMMLCRAEASGLLVCANDGELSVAPPSLSDDAVLTLQYGATIHDLDAEIDARLQYKTLKASSWNYTDQELSDSMEAENPGVPEAGNLTPDELADAIGEEEFRLFHSGKMPEPELQSWLNGAMLKHRLAKIRGKVTVDGTAEVQPGNFIEINGIGERFAGKLFVSGVFHSVEEGNWKTTFQFGINPEWFARQYTLYQPQAGGLLPPIQGLQVGVVTKLEGDPEGEDRIQVRLPIIHKEEDGIWSRISTLDAGNERGTYFRPEIDDEVIVGFINNDPRHAVVLGMMHSSSKPSPEPCSDDNHLKGYVSREGMKLTFDDEKVSVQIETPSGNKLLLTEEDSKIEIECQNGNKIVMDSEGIAIESIKDIVLKASGDIKTEAINQEITGSASAKMSASGAEINLSGTATLSGSVVNIN